MSASVGVPALGWSDARAPRALRERPGSGAAAGTGLRRRQGSCRADLTYGRIYYRDDNGDLLTGLIPIDGTPTSGSAPTPANTATTDPPGSIVRPSPDRAGRRPIRLPEHHLHQRRKRSPRTSAAPPRPSQPIEISARPFTPMSPARLSKQPPDSSPPAARTIRALTYCLTRQSTTKKRTGPERAGTA